MFIQLAAKKSGAIGNKWMQNCLPEFHKCVYNQFSPLIFYQFSWIVAPTRNQHSSNKVTTGTQTAVSHLTAVEVLTTEFGNKMLSRLQKKH